MAFKGRLDTLRQAPFLTLFAIAIFVGLIAYAVLHGTGGSALPTETNGPRVSPLAPMVVFESPLDGSSVSNPVTVAMAIGGVRFQGPGEPAQPGYGHLGVIIDGATPAIGATFAADATHLDLSDGSHQLMLPPLSLGPHTLTAVFMNAADVISEPLVTATISITVTGSTPAPTG
jgi:hypothetical protein